MKYTAGKEARTLAALVFLFLFPSLPDLRLDSESHIASQRFAMARGQPGLHHAYVGSVNGRSELFKRVVVPRVLFRR